MCLSYNQIYFLGNIMVIRLRNRVEIYNWRMVTRSIEDEDLRFKPCLLDKKVQVQK